MYSCISSFASAVLSSMDYVPIFTTHYPDHGVEYLVEDVKAATAT